MAKYPVLNNFQAGFRLIDGSKLNKALALLNAWAGNVSGTVYNAAFSALTAVTVAATGSILSSSATAGSGYATGAGGAVTQATDKTTGVTLSKPCGAITMNNAQLAAGAAVSFTLTNTLIAATDVVLVSIKSAATAGKYTVVVDAVGSGSCVITLFNYSAGNLSEAVVLNFAVIKAVAA